MDTNKIIFHDIELKEYLYWKELCQEFKRKFGEKYKIDISNKRNVWVQFSKGIMSCARYLGNFNNIEEFDKYVRFFLSKNLVHELPMVLKREIYGYGFALSCDFLKELGYADYGKPDVHIKEIFKELKIVDSKNDFDFFKKFSK